MSILVVGTVAYDALKTPFGERPRILGGSATHFSVSASFFADVHLIAAVGDDFAPESEEPLHERGVDISGLERVEGGKTFFWRGEYGYDMNTAHTLDTSSFERDARESPATSSSAMPRWRATFSTN